jgi:hypothetical protein
MVRTHVGQQQLGLLAKLMYDVCISLGFFCFLTCLGIGQDRLIVENTANHRLLPSEGICHLGGCHRQWS